MTKIFAESCIMYKVVENGLTYFDELKQCKNKFFCQIILSEKYANQV